MRQASATRTTHRRPTVDLRDTESPIKRFLRRNLVGLCGLSIIACAAALAAALATWSVADPSLNHATDEPVRNALGRPGAIIADILMQTIGLATAVFLVPIVLWGWRLLAGHALRIGRRRISYWVVGTVLAAGALAALPVASSWPLPTGLGGFFGDTIHAVPALITSNLTAGAAMIVGSLGLGIPAAFFLIASAGWFSSVEKDEQEVLAHQTARGHGHPQEPEYMDEDDEEPESRLSLAFSATIGLVSHWALLSWALFRRLTGLSGSGVREPYEDWEEEDEAVAEYEPEDKSQASLLKRFRRSLADKLMPNDEDGLETYYGSRAGDADHTEPLAGSEEGYYDEDDYEEEDGASFAPGDLLSDKGPVANSEPRRPVGIASPKTAAEPIPAGRVIPQAPRPKPGKRVIAEAQPSFLGAPEEYELPPLRLLAEPKATGKVPGLSADALEQNARILEGVLEDFGVRGEIIEVRPGPVVTLYELEPAPGIKSSRVIGLADDIARSMSAISARVAVIPGKNAIGIELPNSRRETVYLRELLAAQDFEKSKSKLALGLGKTINGEGVVADLARMPHLLVAGTTGSGKSVAINTMILSLLYRLNPDQCKMIMIDPKMLELSIYDGIPHLLTPVVTDPKKAVVALKWTVREMEERYKKMSKMGVRNIDGYNTRIKQALEKGESFTRTVQTGFDRDTGQPVYEDEELPLEQMPYIVVIVDEMADLMMVAGKDIEGAIQRLAQMARAAGIHLIMATQRPSVDVITGTIKANFPTRISFQVTSKIDSRTILGEMGAEQLLGMGDMLFMAGGGRIQRVHGPFVSDDEVEDIVKHLKVQGTPQYLEAVTEEEDTAESPYDGGLAGGDEGNDLYDKAVAIVLRDKKASTSYVQRRLSIGYNRAASLIERMEQEGLISSANHAGKREILVKNGVEDDI
ncbi:S-DNA-T family DNA segregation ATPase FtsK/SpoIIIE [Roseibium hamelinense]|uniref:DNA translocase FtsK n=1 Tax=Roseibium hamelinense TaxID=150831 RepID=A0A562SPX7_9HYPH|nr:DNA translocase FtsK [Roseibium hamelinense]MTI44052.1 DNA translocase FtsK [Roseibium hamelinense]TWI82740.1 S-DNA-T family DNA segregation ATPase FtsK/SpoIIIE [Roseibium hamelinense]